MIAGASEPSGERVLVNAVMRIEVFEDVRIVEKRDMRPPRACDLHHAGHHSIAPEAGSRVEAASLECSEFNARSIRLDNTRPASKYSSAIARAV